MPDLSLLTLATLAALVFVAGFAWSAGCWLWVAFVGTFRRGRV
jgi:hypothetical protein